MIQKPKNAALARIGRKGGRAGRGAVKARSHEAMSAAGKLGAARRWASPRCPKCGRAMTLICPGCGYESAKPPETDAAGNQV